MEYRHHPSPIPGVSVLIVRDGAVLVVRRGRPPLKGYWALPGGRIEHGESAADAAVREVREETGLAVGDLALLDTLTLTADTGARYVLTVFRGTAAAGEAVAGDDAAELRWIAPEEDSSLPLTEQTRAMIARHARMAPHAH